MCPVSHQREGGPGLNEVAIAGPPPPPAARLLRRPRVQALLRRAAERPVALVQAPVGFGKTTAVRQWLGARADDPTEVTWFDLDARSAASTVDRLRDDLRALPAVPPLVVLDELQHLPDGELLADLVAAALARPGTHLLLITRAAPRLPLGLLRSRGQLAEVVDEQLCFTAEEYRDLLRLHGHQPADAAVAAAVAGTHGWPALLQVVAEHHDDHRAAHQVATLLADYTETEVLATLGEEEAHLLADAAALPRLDPRSARTLTGRDDAWARLTDQHRAGVPMRWPDAGSVELNPVLRRALTERLPSAGPERVAAHENRVIDHLRSSDDGLAAVEWLLTAGRYRRAVEVLSVELLPRLHSDAKTIGSMLDRLAHLADWRVAMMQATHQLTVHPDRDPATMLHAVQTLLASSTEELTAIQAAFVESFRLGVDRRSGYRLGITPLASETLLPSLEVTDNVRLQRLAAASLHTEHAFWHLHHGALEPAHAAAQQTATMARLARADWICAQAQAVDALALALLGEQQAARVAARSALDLGATTAVGDGSILDPARFALAWTSLEALDLTTTQTHLADLAPRGGLPGTEPYLTYLTVMATALTHPDEATHRLAAYRHTDPPLTPFQHSLMAVAGFRAALAAGELVRAEAELDVLRSLALTHQQPLIDVGQSRLWARSGREREAVALLLPYLEQPPRLSPRDATGLMSSLAVVAERAGEHAVAQRARDRWHAASERSGLPVDGSRLQHMMRRLFDEPVQTVELSPAERHVLQHLDTALPLGSVAEQLYISANTLKTHLRHLYRKLGVNGRDEAVQRARALGL